MNSSIFFRVLYEVVLKYLPSSDSCGGVIYNKMRTGAVKKYIKFCDIDVTIDRKAVISSKVSIGKNSGIGRNCELRGRVDIGENVMMGPECVFFSCNHAFADVEKPICQQGFQEEQIITIGDDTWIGRRVLVLPGIQIGNHCIVGAGAVVSKDIPDWAIAVGNPATVKKYRK